MSNRKQGQPSSQPPPTQPAQTSNTSSNQSVSQVGATFAPLQLPVPVSNLSSSTQSQQKSNVSQSILYRSENNTQYSHAKAILWQIRYIISGLVSKKGLAQVTQDLQTLSLQFDHEFDKYLVRELIEQIDLKDPNKPSRDRSEPVKCILLNQELGRMCLSPSFLLYFDEISKYIFGDGHHKDFLKELASRLKLSAKMQLLIALSLYESSLSDEDRLESSKLVKQKLVEYHASGAGKVENVEEFKSDRIYSQDRIQQDWNFSSLEYALHRLLHILTFNSEFDSTLDGAQAAPFEAAKRFLFEHNQIKPSQHVALRLTACDGDLINFNPTPEDPANSLIRHGSGLSHLCQVNRLIEPWEVLLDLGQSSSLNYQILSLALQDFKEINEKTMANMLLHLAVYYQGQDDLHSRIVFSIFETNKTGDASKLKTEPSEKQTQTQWHAGHFSRAQRENYAHLKWDRVLESFTELPNDCLLSHEKFDAKAYSFFIQLFNKSKPQNVLVPISLLLEEKWLNPGLQLQFIQHAINIYITGDDKTFSFAKCSRRIGQVSELSDVNSLMIDVWSSPEVIQILLHLSETYSYHKVRKILDAPIANCPEYLLLALSLAKVSKGTYLLDELLSILMRGFLESHPQSISVLKKLWDFNSELLVRSISEICNDVRVNSKLNIQKALEIAQGINDSLIRFVKSEDYSFAVSLGVLAGDKDFLNYDGWLTERFQTVGPSFIRSLSHYLICQVFRPIQDFLMRNKLQIRNNIQIDQQASPEQENNEEQKKIDNEINLVLEKAHLTKDRLLLTVEHLQTFLNGPTDNQSAPAPNESVRRLVRTVMESFKQVFPNHSQNQQQQEIEKIANKYFESVFKADSDVVEQKITEFLQKMHTLSQTRHSNERDGEIFVLIVHTFFDEYRFISSFKDKKDLISFAKLFGGVINKTILDDTLMNITVYFMIQALQNDDARLVFGIEALKQCYQQLKDLPAQITEIYTTYSDKIRDYDPVFYAKFAQFYNQINSSKQNKQSDNKKLGQDLFSSFSEGDFEADPKKQVAKGQDRGDSQLKSKANPANPELRQPVANKPQTQTKSNAAPTVSNEKRKSPDQTQQLKPVRSEDVRITQPSLGLDFKQFPVAANENPFSIDSAPFNSLPVQAETKATLHPDVKPIINTDAIAFNPNSHTDVAAVFQADYQAGKEQKQSEEIVKWQEHIDKIISEAKKNNRAEIPIAELIEDPCLLATPPENQKDIRFICNNTGKETQHQRLEEANKLFAQPNPEQTLNWFLHYFLTQRLMNLQPQLPLFIDMFRKFNVKNVVQKCIKTSLDILKRCMLIQDEDIHLVMRRGQAVNPVKNYVQMLGTFVGMLTFAQTRPVFRNEFDLKQLLIEGFQTKNKLAVLFVCRVIKEATKDRFNIFTKKLPYVRSLLEILKEGQDQNLLNLRPGDDFIHEFSSVLKEFNCDRQNDINTSNMTTTVKAHLLNQIHLPQQQVEVCYFDRKAPVIPIRIRSDSLVQEPSSETDSITYPSFPSIGLPNNGGLGEVTSRFNTQENIMKGMLIQTQVQDAIHRLFYIPETELCRLLCDVIQQSVGEILPPVVTRSVSIALITTRELVLKDFTYDSDINKVNGAIDEIVKNLAGSLALVTCREPLRLSLTQFLFKEMKETCFRLGLEKQLVNLRKENLNATSFQQEASQSDKTTKDYITSNEDTILQFCQDLSKDNLELGCKIVKDTVFEEAVKRIRQDEEIKTALEKRVNAAKSGRPFVDETYVSNFADLPEKLKPNRNGLTSQQLQVYSDFSKLNQQYSFQNSQIYHGANHGGRVPMFENRKVTSQIPNPPTQFANWRQAPKEIQNKENSYAQNNNPIATHSFTLQQILKDLESKERQQLSLFMRSVLTLKIQEMNKQSVSLQDTPQLKKVLSDASTQLKQFVERKFRQLYAEQNDESQSRYLIDVIALIVTKFKVQDLQKTLNDVYFDFEEDDILNVEITIALLRTGILPLKEWEKRFSNFVRDAPGNLIDKVVYFLVRFADSAVIRSLIESSTNESKFPNLFKETQKLEKSIEQDPNQEELSEQLSFVNEQFAAKSLINNQAQLKNLFIQWVELQQIVDEDKLQQGMHAFYTEFSQRFPMDQDIGKLFEFCDVIIKQSIDLTTTTQNGELRQNNALLNYNFIDSCVKLVFSVMLNPDFNFNKQEFMSKILDLIKSKLDLDHKRLLNSLQQEGNSDVQSYRFNQKPYFRMLMNILKAVNFSDCFNQKAQRQILIDIASLMGELSPDKYPAFAFAWLEIISHRMFMPHFIKRSDPTQNQGWFILKDLLVSCFSFLKHNMIKGQEMTKAIEEFYKGTMRVVLMILLDDQKDFLAQFHYSFICSLPDHAIQLKNIILSAYPKLSKEMPDPFDLNLNIQLNTETAPEILSNYEASLSINNLKGDLDTFFKTQSPELLDCLCSKLMQSIEKIGGREVPSNSVINAVILYCLKHLNTDEYPFEVVFERIMLKLDDVTRVCFINAAVNELRYPNSHTLQVCLALVNIYKRIDQHIKDQITRVLFERLQAYPYHPWGLQIIFREFNQNGEVQFYQSNFMKNNKKVIDYLFQDRLQRFSRLIQDLRPQQQN